MTTDYIIPIKATIEQIDIKGQYLSLAAPVYLTGQLNISALLADFQTAITQTGTTQTIEQYLKTEQLSDATSLTIGIDEAGRGPLLGSVNVAGAIIPSAWSGLIEEQPLQHTPLSTLTDSKKLSEKKRNILYPLVQQSALGYIIADIPAAVIDQINILQATMLGMRLCTEELLTAIVEATTNKQNLPPVQILYDGNRCPELDYTKLTTLGISQDTINCQAWVKGDARHTSIAAASILAKVSRDQTMYDLDARHPQYGIAQHKGYPTRAHIQAIQDYGVLNEHRRSFGPIKKAL